MRLLATHADLGNINLKNSGHNFRQLSQTEPLSPILVLNRQLSIGLRQNLRNKITIPQDPLVTLLIRNSPGGRCRPTTCDKTADEPTAGQLWTFSLIDTFGNKRLVLFPRHAFTFGEIAQNLISRNRTLLAQAKQLSMPAVTIAR